MKLESILLLILIGLAGGFVGGLAGVGGGIAIVPMLVFFFGMTQHEAQGTSIGTLIFPVAAMAAFNYCKGGYINFKYVAFIAVSFIIGGYLGSKLAISLNQKLLKRIFATILVLGAVKMYFDSFK